MSMYNKYHLCFLSSDNAAQYSLSLVIYYYIFSLLDFIFSKMTYKDVPFIPQNWQGYLSSEVDRALSQGVIPIELAQEKVMLALTLTLVKGVCELVPSLTRSLFDTMLQYIGHRRPRWLLGCRIRGNHPTPLEGRRSKRQTANFASPDGSTPKRWLP